MFRKIVLFSIFALLVFNAQAFGYSTTPYADWGIFGTKDHFEVKDGGVSDWEFATKTKTVSGWNIVSSELGDYKSGIAYNYSLAYSSGTGLLTLSIGKPSGGTASKSFAFTNTAGFKDLWILAKTGAMSDSAYPISTVTVNDYIGTSRGTLEASGSKTKSGYHLSGQTFGNGTLLSGTFTFTNSRSNSDTEMFVGVENATHAPIPAAVWLLGTGLVGLVGIRRRFRS